jgi:hypothetical protein
MLIGKTNRCQWVRVIHNTNSVARVGIRLTPLRRRPPRAGARAKASPRCLPGTQMTTSDLAGRGRGRGRGRGSGRGGLARVSGGGGAGVRRRGPHRGASRVEVLLGVADAAAQDAADNVVAALIAGDGAVGDGDGQRPGSARSVSHAKGKPLAPRPRVQPPVAAKCTGKHGKGGPIEAVRGSLDGTERNSCEN